MVKTLILTQGGLAAELKRAAETIAGEAADVAALGLDWDDTLAEATEKTARKIAQLDPRDGLLILTDTFGGTPYNVALAFREPDRVEILAGVNLPMVLRLGCRGGEDLDLEETARWIEAKGKRSICRAAAGAGETSDDCGDG